MSNAERIKQIAVIGTGTMGRGIAYLSALAGYDTTIHDVDPAALDAAKASIESTLRKGVEKAKISSEAASQAAGQLHLASERRRRTTGDRLQFFGHHALRLELVDHLLVLDLHVLALLVPVGQLHDPRRQGLGGKRHRDQGAANTMGG